MVRRTRRVDNNKKKNKRQQHNKKETGSLLWTILMLGVCFCMVDVLYLFFASHTIPNYFEKNTSLKDRFSDRRELIKQQSNDNDNKNDNNPEKDTTKYEKKRTYISNTS